MHLKIALDLRKITYGNRKTGGTPQICVPLPAERVKYRSAAFRYSGTEAKKKALDHSRIMMLGLKFT